MLKPNKITVMLIDEALSGVQLADRIKVPSKRTMTDAGQMHVPCSFARTGTQLYTAGQLGLLDEDPNKVITIYRDEADVFDEASMESFRSAPVTIGHPKDANGKPIAVSSENAKELQVGMLEGMPVRDEDTLGGILVLTAQEAIDALEDGTQELSAGYVCDIEEVDGKFYQRNIRANHIAIVAKGRAGSSCRISDEALELQDAVALMDELAAVKEELETQKQLVIDFKQSTEDAELATVALKAELADARLAATEGVIERCEVIEQARLIADMRDLGDKPTSLIRKMVVEDQMPDRNLEGKSEAYIEAMFEILADTAKGETPMAKLMKTQESHVVVDAKTVVDPVAAARARMMARNQKASK